MGRTPYLAYVWPGLPMILARGSWIGLAWAVGFASLINLLLFASLWWPELFSPHLRNGLWLITAVFWVGASFASFRDMRSPDSSDDSHDRPTLGDATELYLRADWFGAEKLLVDLLRRNPRDVDASLMLATLWRHTGRIQEASQQLDRLELLEGSRKWTLEISQERNHLEEARRQPAVAPEQQGMEMNRAA